MKGAIRREGLDLPTIMREPFNTFPDKVTADGYRYRRIVYHSVCRSMHEWDDMALVADGQEDMISWDVWSRSDEKAVWFLSGCSSVELSLIDELQRTEYAAG